MPNPEKSTGELEPFLKSGRQGDAKWWQWLTPIAIVLLLWQLASLFFPTAILPSPLETVQALLELMADPDFYRQLAITAARGVLGFSMAMVIGLGLGLWMGWRQSAYRFFHPLLLLAINIPLIAWIALLLIWLGLGDGPPLFVILVTATPLVAVNVAQGVKELDPTLLEMAQFYQFSRSDRLQHLVLPALAGRIFAAMLLAMGFTWRVLVMAEFLGSTTGLGYRLSWARQNLDTDQAFAYILVIVLLSVGLEYGLLRPWYARSPWAVAAGEAFEQPTHRHGAEIHTHGSEIHEHPHGRFDGEGGN